MNFLTKTRIILGTHINTQALSNGTFQFIYYGLGNRNHSKATMLLSQDDVRDNGGSWQWDYDYQLTTIEYDATLL
jgi:hypothetical protein